MEMYNDNEHNNRNNSQHLLSPYRVLGIVIGVQSWELGITFCCWILRSKLNPYLMNGSL